MDSTGVELKEIAVEEKKEKKVVDLTNDDETTATMAQMFSQAEPYDWMLMVLGSVGGAITGASLPAFNVLFGSMLDNLNASGSNFTQEINKVCLYFVGLAILNMFSGFCQCWCWMIAGERQTQRFREKYVGSILSQEIGWFDINGAGELSTKVVDLTGKVKDGMGRKVGDMMQYLFQVMGSLAVGFWLQWQLTLVLMCAIPLIAIAGAFMIGAVTEAVNQSLEQYAQAGGLATESLGAIRTVTALNSQPSIIKRYREFLFQAMNVGIIKGFKVGIGNGSVFGACFLTYSLGFWYGAKLIRESYTSGCSGSECVSGGDVLAVFFSIIMGSIALGQLAPPVTAFVGAKAAIGHMFKIIDRKPLIDGFSEEGLKPTGQISGAIELKGIEFSYPSRPDIIVCRDYDLSIKAGETVALVGASGCGKSTIINLLLRFFDPQKGQVLLDGVDLKDLNIRWLRRNIGYVGQEPVLFAGSIADNIAYGINPHIKEDKSTAISHKPLDAATIKRMVQEAAIQANAHDFISEFPDGYDTDVGSNGVAMSGGQKQRIAIARALIKKPAVLLLDEATSALDANSERIVQESIDKLQANKSQTTIVIAHRLSTIRNADKICFIANGVVAEMGTHDELLARNGQYAGLVRLQVTGVDEENSIALDEEGGTALMLADLPAAKAVELDIETAAGSADGYAKVDKAALAEEPELSKDESKSVGKRVWGLIFQHKAYFFGAIMGAAVFGAIFPVWGLILANTQNMFYLTDIDEMRDRAARMSQYYIALAVCAFLSSIFQFGCIAQVGERISAKVRSDMFESIMRREISFFDDDRNSIGTLTSRLADDSRIVNKSFGEALAKQLQALFTLVIGVALGMSASWKIALVVIATFPVSIAASAVQMQAIAGQQYEEEGEPAPASASAPASAPKPVKKGPTDLSKSLSVKDVGEPDEDKKAVSSVIGTSPGAMINTVFTHMRTVSAFSMQHVVLEHYNTTTKGFADKRSERAVMAGIGFGGANSSMFFTYALLFWYGGVLISNGEVTFVEMMTAILTLMLGALGLGQALTDMGDQKTGVQVAARLFKLIDDGPLSPIDGLSKTGEKMSKRSVGRIELRGVNFSYPSRPDVQVCKEYSLVIEPGEMVALVGPSGSGKSTIVNLLLRFYDPSSGSVLLDGKDIKDLNVRWLRSQIGFVGQEPKLFTGSVATNVALGRAEIEGAELLSLEDAMKVSDAKSGSGDCLGGMLGYRRVETVEEREAVVAADIEAVKEKPEVGAEPDEDVRAACMAAHAHDFIKTFPQGYDTDVGEGSIMVSGGQKQRIAIARALIKKPAVLLLDEATSALDANSERIVQESIDELQANKSQTTIVIAHRLSTIRNADKIVVIDRGSVVEMGTHDELLANDGLYARLWAKQGGIKRSASSKASLGSLEA